MRALLALLLCACGGPIAIAPPARAAEATAVVLGVYSQMYPRAASLNVTVRYWRGFYIPWCGRLECGTVELDQCEGDIAEPEPTLPSEGPLPHFLMHCAKASAGALTEVEHAHPGGFTDAELDAEAHARAVLRDRGM